MSTGKVIYLFGLGLMTGAAIVGNIQTVLVGGTLFIFGLINRDTL